jgi:hypothetical protein
MVASTRARKSITAKTRAEDDRLREKLRHADIGKLKKLMAPLIERTNENRKTRTK